MQESSIFISLSLSLSLSLRTEKLSEMLSYFKIFKAVDIAIQICYLILSSCHVHIELSET